MRVPSWTSIPGLPRPAAPPRGLRAFLPALGPTAALRWACYLGALVCLGGMRVVDHYLPGGANNASAAHAVSISALLLVALVLFFLSSRSTIPAPPRGLLPHGRLLPAVGLLGALLVVPRSLALIAHLPGQLAQPRHDRVDSLAMVDCGARLWLRGRDPYTAFDLVACLRGSGVPADATTPLQVGAFARVPVYPTHQQVVRAFDEVARHPARAPAAFEAHVSYPAGSFLLAAPVLALGWHELGLFYLLCLLLADALLACWAPRRPRPWLALLALATVTAWEYAIGIATDSLDVLPLLVAWATWRRAWVSAVLLGAALATRQNAWFFAPFYAILLGRVYGRRPLLGRVLVMAAVFGLLNGPFVLRAPAAWAASVFAQLRDPMFSLGNGMIAFADLGWLPLWPRPTYAALELAALCACALYYARTCRRQPGTACVLALLPLLVAWRSPLLYVAPLALLCLWPLLAERGAHGDDAPDGGMVGGPRAPVTARATGSDAPRTALPAARDGGAGLGGRRGAAQDGGRGAPRGGEGT